MPNSDNMQAIREMKKRQEPTSLVDRKNKLMWEAWTKGKELLVQLGRQAGYGKMQKTAGKNKSTAERLRKWRAMADRITEKELERICKLCDEKQHPWGPTFLVELSRLKYSRERQKIAKTAIKEKWGLKLLRQRIRRTIGPQRPTVRVGRKRKIKWTDKVEVLDELHRLCLGWSRFAADLNDKSGETGAKLSVSLGEQFAQITDLLSLFQKSVERRLKKSRGG